jgi:rhodanese-related sulfurtransferase
MSRKTSQRHSPRRPAARKTKLNPWLLLGLVAVLAIAAYVLLNPGLQGVQAATITPQQAYEKYNQGVFFLDVRTQEEWDTVHAPNTTLIPLDELSQRLDELPRDREIVVICRSGNRSQQGRDILLDGGFENVSSMSGGLNEWGALGYPLE